MGCGWGGLARFAAREFGAEVFGITLSREQLALARERVAAEGLQDRVQLELMDYRDLPQDGRFDKVVSVGMFEHVGHANLPLYCQRLFGAVRHGGLVLNHGITSRHLDGRPVAHGAGEFIDRYVFPHGELPHPVGISSCISEAGLEIVDVESLRLHYARTLQLWSERLEARLAEAQALVPERALRIWRLYGRLFLWLSPRLDRPASDSRHQTVARWRPRTALDPCRPLPLSAAVRRHEGFDQRSNSSGVRVVRIMLVVVLPTKNWRIREWP